MLYFCRGGNTRHSSFKLGHISFHTTAITLKKCGLYMESYGIHFTTSTVVFTYNNSCHKRMPPDLIITVYLSTDVSHVDKHKSMSSDHMVSNWTLLPAHLVSESLFLHKINILWIEMANRIILIASTLLPEVIYWCQ